MRKLLIDMRRKSSKVIKLLAPAELKAALCPLANRILCELAKSPSYPNELAKRLKVHEQKVYYHIRALRLAGLIEEIKQETKRGALCQYFIPTAQAFGFELSLRNEAQPFESEDDVLKAFLHEFIKDGFFSGSIVVGAPEPHGPYLTYARDSHYATQLALFMGNYCIPPKRFIVKLDTEVKAEDALKRNMILIGGPVANIISQELNEKLKVRFVWKNNWQLYSEQTKKKYASEDLGLVAKVRNPWDGTKTILLLAGLKFEGTKACILALTQRHNELLRKYKEKEEFYAIIRALDKDGDGKVDEIEVVE